MEPVGGALRQRGAFDLVCKFGDVFGGQFILLLDVLRPLLLFGSRLITPRPFVLGVDSLQLCLVRLPLQIAKRVFIGELGHIIDGSDVGVFALVGVLKFLLQGRKLGLVLFTSLFLFRPLGIDCLALFSVFVLTAAEIAIPLLFAGVQIFLRFARQGLEAFFFSLGPRPRRLDG